MKTRVLLFVSTLLLGAGLPAFAGSSGGGASIAGAPDLPVGQRVVDGASTDSGDVDLYWRIALASSDQLRVDYGSNNQNGIELTLYAPNVTDYTLRDANPLVEDSTNSKHEVKFVAPSPGRYTLRVQAYHQLAYEISAYVRHHTITSFSVPSLLEANAVLRVRGSVAGTSGGRLLIRVTGPHRYVRKVIATMNSSGDFSWTTKVSRSGVYHVRAIYYGDDEHLPSSAVRTVRVG
jgi:Bacterial pre-peptidase C-terminal domain